MRFYALALALNIVACRAFAQQPTATPLPPGATASWDLASAYRETTPTRERICINGLWRWQPAEPGGAIPVGNWGCFKVPGAWPGITDYMQKDCQTVYAHRAWNGANLAGVQTAWYEREISIPASWFGRRIALTADYVNSLAEVFVDGRHAGEIRFPAGELDISALCKPGSRHLLSMKVTALPLKAVMTRFADTNNATVVRGSVARRGLCGDIYLVGEPRGERIIDVRVEPSVRQKRLTIDIGLDSLQAKPSTVRADIEDQGKVVHRAVFPISAARALNGARYRFSTSWMPAKLWDIHTPQYQLSVRVTLLSPSGKVLDQALPVRFGFREMWINGRDFYLNGSRIYLQALPFDNAQVGAAWSTYAAARESMLRLKSFGINFVYTHNYDCEPGSHLSFEEILRAADDTGMLVALTQPHFSAYDWQKPDADRTNGYLDHARFYARVAQNHPSVVAYAMSHNATSYEEAKNPDMMDGRTEPRESWAMNNVKKALRAEAIVRSLDPSRIVYHHSSGSLGAMYTENFYVNFAPIQELSDWFGKWATQGVKPMFLCEYGVPFSWDWTMYRGWYKGKREWGSAAVPWELCIAEWNAQFVGDRAYKISEREKADIRWEAAQFRSRRDGWHRWDYPTPVGSGAFDERNEVFASYITDNWRAYRTWGVSAFSPWEYEVYWMPRQGVDRKRRELPVDWTHLQRPGYSPDYVDSQYETLVTSYDRTDWVPSVAAKALLRNNRALLGYIGGKPAKFTSKDHNFAPGDTVEKQLIVINNSRETVTCECRWSVLAARDLTCSSTVRIRTGDQARIPVRFTLDRVPSSCTLDATFRFSTGETQTDSFRMDVVGKTLAAQPTDRIACFDPKGETTALLSSLGVHPSPVTADSDLANFDLLIIGKQALTLTGPCPDVRRVREGLKVIVFEQTAEVLERRLGFRIAEYGLRRVFPRVPDHPMLAGIGADNLHDWAGEATLSSPRLSYTLKPMYGPMVEWCGIPLPHVWRCGCQGNVASVLIEKPAAGDFLPLVDGGYSLQYSPLLQYREGKGTAIFCQLDVTGRTESDPAARRIAANLLKYAADWKPSPSRQVVYAGESAGLSHLRAAGFAPRSGEQPIDPAKAILVLGPGSDSQCSATRAADWQHSGGWIVALGLRESALRSLVSPDIRLRNGEHISSEIEPGSNGTWKAGIGTADVLNRDPRAFPVIESGAISRNDGIIGYTPSGSICQLVPWQFDVKAMNQKRTFRRTSFLLSRILSNMGADSTTPLLDDAVKPVGAVAEHRWLDGLYLDTPSDWDDPYRFFGW